MGKGDREGDCIDGGDQNTKEAVRYGKQKLKKIINNIDSPNQVLGIYQELNQVAFPKIVRWIKWKRKGLREYHARSFIRDNPVYR